MLGCCERRNRGRRRVRHCTWTPALCRAAVQSLPGLQSAGACARQGLCRHAPPCPAKLEGKEKGDLVSLVTADIELLEVFYAHTLSPAAIALTVSIIVLIFLFATTIRENLLVAKADASDEELIAALEKAALRELVERLPQGLDTQLAELGDSLSGGERQRLGLARVFLQDAPLLLLDEPTSNLDALSEASVLKALQENRADKTVVIVTHRASAGAIADDTYALSNGTLLG